MGEFDQRGDAPERRRPFSRAARLARRPGVVVVAAFLLVAGVTGAVAVGRHQTHHAPGANGQDPAPHTGTQPTGPTSHSGPVSHNRGPRPAAMSLVSYRSCAGLITDVRSHAAASIGPDGVPSWAQQFVYPLDAAAKAPAPGGTPQAEGDTSGGAPPYSTTNVQEAGVDEPDIVKSDGSRIVSIVNGVLRVVDTRTKKLTGELDLTLYANWWGARLLLAGDRALVLLDSPTPIVGGPRYPAYGGAGPIGTQNRSTFLQIDLAGVPRVVATFRATGSFLDARMVGSTARLVVANSPRITPSYDGTPQQRASRNRAAIEAAPLSAWLPSYEVSTAAATTTTTVPCERVSHTQTFSGGSMLTVYTFDLARELGDPQPVSLAADGNTVYSTDTSLYIASNPDWYFDPSAVRNDTQVHRFDITGPGAPTYLGSATVPGRLLNQYSMSDYSGHLRLATTSTRGVTTETAVYVLDANTLKITGQVGGLGLGEQVYAVRFLGPLGYVVTFRQVDPLYVLDLHDPASPRMAGQLKVTGYSTYLHPVRDGQLLGVGEDATVDGRTNGLQVSLFDVSRPSEPRRTDQVLRRDAAGYSLDPHAFLYWQADHLAVVPLQDQQSGSSDAWLVLRVDGPRLEPVGIVKTPASSPGGDGVQRCLVVGHELWTMSSAGLQISDLASLTRQAWIAFE